MRQISVYILTFGISACGSAGTEETSPVAALDAITEATESAAADQLGQGTVSPASSTSALGTVTVDTNSNLGKLSTIAVGVNAAAWDSNLLDPQVPDLVRNAGVQVLRYPGGSTSDNYHWLTNAPDDPNQGATDVNAHFDAFMSVVSATRAQPMVTVNYGSGTPAEAADWVRYANRGGRRYRGPVPSYPGASSTGHNYGVKYWEIGNEVYGDGTYGATWEVNHNPHDPTTYAKGVVSYSAAMKAVDPTIKIGLVLTAPGNWPDGQTNDASPQPWNDSVLAVACSAIDFVAVHWYAQGPTGESDAALLAAPQSGESTPVSYTPSIASMVTTLKSTIAAYCGAHASAVQIMVTETSSVSYNPGKQTTSIVNALFLADQVMTWLENGVTNVDWWALHNSPFDGNADPALYGNYTFGDYGILSRGLTSASGAVQPPAETPFPAYHGLAMLSHLGHQPCDTLLSTTSSDALVAAHAVKQADGKVNVMLINKDPTTSRIVKLAVPGNRSRGWARLFSFGTESSAIGTSTRRLNGASLSLELQPYSLNVVSLP